MKPRKPLPSRRAPLKRGGRPKPVNRKRRVSEFARAYGSKERVEWVQSRGCLYCEYLSPFETLWSGLADNAHTGAGSGMGRKAGYETIVPLCRSHHMAYDQHRGPFNNAASRQVVQDMAPKVERAWQAHTAREDR